MLTEYLLNRPVVTPPARSAERSGRVMGTPESSPAFPASEGFAEENQSISGSRESGFTSQAWELSLSPESLEKARQMQARLQAENGQNTTQNSESAEAEDQTGKTAEQEQTPKAGESPAEQKLTDEEKQEVQELKKRDAEVRTHEQAHVAAAGGHAMGGPKYEYETGPDQKRYAKSGHVNIDTSKEDSPEATLQKAKTVERAAMAPAEPSPQDLKVAAKARKMAMDAQQELNEEKQGEISGNTAADKTENASHNSGSGSAAQGITETEDSPENSSGIAASAGPADSDSSVPSEPSHTPEYAGNDTLENSRFQSAAAAYASFSATPLSGGIDLAA